MSCNGCRVLRKGCSEDCMLRHCLLWIENPQAQANATVFVAKFFGRATLMSFLSSVPPNQRSALFQSLMYEAVGRTINPVNGAVGLLWTGKWQLCQMGVEKVLRGSGGALTPLTQLLGHVDESEGTFESLVEGGGSSSHQQYYHQQQQQVILGSGSRMMIENCEETAAAAQSGLVGSGSGRCHQAKKKQRVGTPSEESDQSSSTLGSSGCRGTEDSASQSERKLLRLFF